MTIKRIGFLFLMGCLMSTGFSVDAELKPVDTMKQIYLLYHDSQTEKGLQLTQTALDQYVPLYEKNPNARLSDPKLKLNKVYQVVASLYTLQGMLYYRDAIVKLDRSKENKFASLHKKMSHKQAISDQDFELAIKKENDKEKIVEKQLKNGGIEKAVSALKHAIEIDPRNPVPHYQLSNIYCLNKDPKLRRAAENEYYAAAYLAEREGDHASARQAKEKLKEFNAKSRYLSRLRDIP